MALGAQVKRLAWLALLTACSPVVDEPLAQNPPVVGAPELEAWLIAGYYLAWHCERVPHLASPPSPHDVNRVCANDAAFGAGTGPFPVDAAYVKESYATDLSVSGYSVQRHTAAGSEAATWFWFRNVPLTDTMNLHDSQGIVADGWAQSGPALTTCAACHQMAGTEGLSGHDFVFNLVLPVP